MSEQEYPGITERIKAMFIDMVVVVIFLLVISFILEKFPDTPFGVKVFLSIFVFILYDPLFTSMFGGTIGHYITGIRVKREFDQSRNIPFHKALLRYGIKVLLGAISLIYVSTNEKI